MLRPLSAVPMLDVIIPVHNQWAVAEPCIESVLAARGKLPFELVVVDDASTDRALRLRLAELSATGKLMLLSSTTNLGFTKSVNRGMRLHKDRDVLLLNSDTVVYGDWLDRLHRAAYSHPKIASVNPLTNASHIGCYPTRSADGFRTFEVTDEELDALAAEANAERRVAVQSTVGFCMYIRRAVINAIGYFDDHHFPMGYGEETDFCYRARKLGWRHLITGDVFVRHWEGQSFGEKKTKLINDMLTVFHRLHPDLGVNDRNFQRLDPIRPLREGLDLARLKRMLGGAGEIRCLSSEAAARQGRDQPALMFDAATGEMRMMVPDADALPNLPVYKLPGEIVALNAMLGRLGVQRLKLDDPQVRDDIAAKLGGRSMDVGLMAALVVA